MTHIWMKDGQRLRAALDAERRFATITQAALANNIRSNVSADEAGVRLDLVDWPAIPHYGVDHGKRTSQLAVHIGQQLDVRDDDLKVLRTAALLHDIGRRAPWDENDPEHAQRSAELAEEVMRATPWWSQSQLRDRVCRLIAAHTMQYSMPPSDPLLVALHDAEAYESFRFVSEGSKATELITRRVGQLLTDWAKNLEHQRRYRALYL
jgi:putative nucleotidyltransferase with HDIG domain